MAAVTPRVVPLHQLARQMVPVERILIPAEVFVLALLIKCVPVELALVRRVIRGMETLVWPIVPIIQKPPPVEVVLHLIQQAMAPLIIQDVLPDVLLDL